LSCQELIDIDKNCIDIKVTGNMVTKLHYLTLTKGNSEDIYPDLKVNYEEKNTENEKISLDYHELVIYRSMTKNVPR
jgi:hypothetical protein